MGKRLNWDRARFVGRETEAAGAVDDWNGFVTVRCRKCGHSGEVGRRVVRVRAIRCSKCGWKGAKPNA